MTVNDISAPREERCNNLRTVRDQICRRCSRPFVAICSQKLDFDKLSSTLLNSSFLHFSLSRLKIEKRMHRIFEHRVRTILELIPNEVVYGSFGK